MNASTTPFPSPIRRAASALLASPWLRPLNDPAAIDDLLSLVSPAWSLGTIRALVVGAVRETASARTLVLEPNRLWPGHVAGQHVAVEVEIRGRRLRRTFSLSSPPCADGLVAITVKEHDRGLVSRWWNRDARIGDVVALSAPSGDFVLPPSPSRVTMLSAGSGITPVMAMLRALDPSVPVLFVHLAHSEEDTIFLRELEGLAARRPSLDLRLRFTSREGRPSADELRLLAAESGGDPAYACGPEGFLASVRDAWREAGRQERLHVERFGPVARIVSAGDGGSVDATRSGATFAAAAGQSILEAAEGAGLRPAHGCRIGVCHTCKCRRLSGTTRDLRDGRLSSEPGELIQLCVSTPVGGVELEL